MSNISQMWGYNIFGFGTYELYNGHLSPFYIITNNLEDERFQTNYSGSTWPLCSDHHSLGMSFINFTNTLKYTTCGTFVTHVFIQHSRTETIWMSQQRQNPNPHTKFWLPCSLQFSKCLHCSVWKCMSKFAAFECQTIAKMKHVH